MLYSLSISFIVLNGIFWLNASSTVLISIFQPVNLTAKRAFWPFLPIAKEKSSFGTIATIALFSSSKEIPNTFEGFNASAT